MLSFVRQPDRLLPEGRFGLRLHVIVRASARPVTMEIVVLAPVFLMTAFGRTGAPFIVGASIARPLPARGAIRIEASKNPYCRCTTGDNGDHFFISRLSAGGRQTTALSFRKWK